LIQKYFSWCCKEAGVQGLQNQILRLIWAELTLLERF
jgi:hypothetical protein